jgi:hypothetical protein
MTAFTFMWSLPGRDEARNKKGHGIRPYGSPSAPDALGRADHNTGEIRRARLCLPPSFGYNKK